MTDHLHQQYKDKEAEMNATCPKQSHKRTRLILEMKEIMKLIKIENYGKINQKNS